MIPTEDFTNVALGCEGKLSSGKNLTSEKKVIKTYVLMKSKSVERAKEVKRIDTV